MERKIKVTIQSELKKISNRYDLMLTFEKIKGKIKGIKEGIKKQG